MSTNKKQTFILYNINIKEIDKKYNIHIKSNIDDSAQNTMNKTSLEELSNNNKTKHFIYLDEAKKNKKCFITMIDHVTNNLIENKTKLNCFWCRHTFNTNTIGCPIKFVDDAYYCDGVFCSFNCCKSFINNNQLNSLYSKSNYLLQNLYKKIYNIDTLIEPAPHWRLLKTYGGHLTINEFRELFYKKDFIPSDNYINLPICQMIGWLYEERIKF